MSYSEFEVEPHWKELAQRYRDERDQARRDVKELGRQLADALKRLSTESAEKPCFAILNPPQG